MKFAVLQQAKFRRFSDPWEVLGEKLSFLCPGMTTSLLGEFALSLI
jgi:hypothetical protein